MTEGAKSGRCYSKARLCYFCKRRKLRNMSFVTFVLIVMSLYAHQAQMVNDHSLDCFNNHVQDINKLHHVVVQHKKTMDRRKRRTLQELAIN